MTTVGFLYPGHFAEDDYPRMEILLDSTIRLVVHHTESPDGAYAEDALSALGTPGRLAAGIEELQRSGVQSIVWACDGGSFPHGWQGAHDQVAALARGAGVPASSTSIGFVHAVRKLGAERVAVAATYPEAVAERFAAFLRETGLEVTGVHAAGVTDAAEAASWDADRLLALAAAADRPDAEAVLIPDTVLHTVAHLPELEEAFGKPVLTANQVAVREALRLADRPAWAPRLGTLFANREQPPAPVTWGSGRAYAHGEKS
ncbi:maleate cis-trans isomerase [Streptomyces sp. KhCrAH-43]|uniref:maleate cis-trans isomerase family protein n=1 Tax=unclassified Streptomyces TaxID=2593676 RepID=UPI000373868E|nr:MULTISPECIES: aspartate/glutamate racemase family protein [unclassified Streptomyces]MYS34619.1 decarboxylase [Streptomyces sp. SID4920]MYX65604.1 decarboxylase [Streptomyces sp. SID8373]RAJ64420.1 maleate cis-trans isomerase [Streptomyces sp. KhCrAH-43]